MSDSDLDDELKALYAEMAAAEQEGDGEMEPAPDAGEATNSHDTPQPHAGEAEADTNTQTTSDTPQAGEAEADQTGSGDQDDNAGTKPDNQPDAGSGNDRFKPSGPQVPVERFTDLRRSARRMEKAYHGAQKALEGSQAEIAQLKARLQLAEQMGHSVPELPDGIDVQAVRDGDPDAVANALLYIQHSLEQVPSSPSGSPQGGSDTPPPESVSEPVPPSWDQFIWSLPDNSPVHELDGWISSGNPELKAAAQAVEKQLWNDPQFNQNLESLYTEVVNRVKTQLSRSVEQQYQKAEQQQAAAPRSLSQAGGAAGTELSLVEQFNQAEDPGAFMDALPDNQKTQLWAALGMS